jgi:acyl carrier protein
MKADEEIVAEIRQLLVEIIGEDYLLDLDVTMDSTIIGDLGMESIELVMLAERLLERHGDRADLMGLVGELDLDGIIGLTVGQVVTHVAAAAAGDPQVASGAQ